ncbi:7319_t:CDS:2 [Entrophospora sp. SA101]|nr:7319_t:CDS:2 [Entrophospora sp. SA101]
MFIQNIGQYISVVRISDEREILNVEFLGLPFRSTKDHTVGDVKKLLIMAVCSLCYSLGDYLDCSVEDAKKVKSYSIQVIENLRVWLHAPDVKLFPSKEDIDDTIFFIN